MEWKFNDPALTLETYYEGFDSYGEKKLRKETLENQLEAGQKELKDCREMLNQVQTRLQGMGECNNNAQMQEELDQTEQKYTEGLAVLDEEFAKNFEELETGTKRRYEEADAEFKQRMNDLRAENMEVSENLSEVEEKALSFEIDRRKFVIESNTRISAYENKGDQEELEYKDALNAWNAEQRDVHDRWDPEIESAQEVIDEIREKHQPEIEACQDVIREKTQDRDEEIGRLQSEKNDVVAQINREIAGYQTDYKQTEKQYKDQIRIAKAQGKPTTRTTNSMTTQLNKINDQIRKAQNKLETKKFSCDQKINDAEFKHKNQIGKAQKKLDEAIQKREDELADPVDRHNGLMRNRDKELQAIQDQIDKRTREHTAAHQKLISMIEGERSAQEKHHQELNSQIIDYAMRQDTCLSDVLQEVYALFEALNSRVETWKGLLASIKGEKASEAFDEVHTKHKNDLVNQEYGSLSRELSEAQEFQDKLSFFTANAKSLKLAGAVLCGAGALMAVIMGILLQSPLAALGAVIAAVGAAVLVLTITKEKKEFDTVSRYITLALDYKDFKGIRSHSQSVTQEWELESMRNLGNKLYDFHYGKQEAEANYTAAVADIKEDKERKDKLIRAESEAKRNALAEKRDSEKREILARYQNEKTSFNTQQKNLQKSVRELTGKIENLDRNIVQMEIELKELQNFMTDFDRNYDTLEKCLKKDEGLSEKWERSTNESHSVLHNDFYIIPENGEIKDGHRKVYRIKHDKKPLVITYDSKLLDGDGGMQRKALQELIRNLLADLTRTVVRMNDGDIYAQYIVDGVGGAADIFRQVKMANFFKVNKVGSRLDEFRTDLDRFWSDRERLAGKGFGIDQVNEARYQEGSRPEIYRIFYMIYQPGESHEKMTDILRRLLPDCYKYGFLPIFICDRDTWNEGQEKDSVYRDIHGYVENPIVLYDGTSYCS